MKQNYNVREFGLWCPLTDPLRQLCSPFLALQSLTLYRESERLLCYHVSYEYSKWELSLGYENFNRGYMKKKERVEFLNGSIFVGQ